MGSPSVRDTMTRIVVVLVASLQYLDNYALQLSQVGHHAKGNRSS
jgi:hypothetical protein